MKQTIRPPRILVIDDHEDVRHLVASILKDLGYEVELAGDGWAGIEKMQSRRPDLVLLDLVMPVIDGWGVLDYLRQMPSPPPVAIVTARGDIRNFVRGVHEGVAAYVFKPFGVRDLVSTCERLLGLARSADVASERRREPRRILAIELATLSKENAPISWAKLIDLSPGGAQVDLDHPLDPGDRLRVALRTPDGHIPLSIEGEVRWRDAANYGFAHGLAFDCLASEEERQLRALLYPS